jgi:ferric-dicitrate binding protein FerR (iron transport regulator)
VKDYARFSAKDFMMDEYFQSWVFDPGENTNSYWQSWLDENADKRTEVEEARTALLQLNFSAYHLPAEDVSQLWNRIRKTDAVPKRRASSKFLFLYGVAASLFILAVGSLFWVKPQTIIEHKTAFGQTKTILLPDSSTVILNSNSSLRLNSNWATSGMREVWLDGEAFFSVVHKVNNQPFKVKTGKEVDIEVLGTTFNVYHRNQTKIVLNSGRIQLSLPSETTDKKIVMKPGELVEYDEKKYVKRNVDPKMYTAWTEHNLVLNRTSLREMIQMISDNYGIEVEVKESLLDQTISGSMPVTGEMELLQQIAKAFRLKVVKEDDRIMMKE